MNYLLFKILVLIQSSVGVVARRPRLKEAIEINMVYSILTERIIFYENQEYTVSVITHSSSHWPCPALPMKRHNTKITKIRERPPENISLCLLLFGPICIKFQKLRALLWLFRNLDKTGLRAQMILILCLLLWVTAVS